MKKYIFLFILFWSVGRSCFAGLFSWRVESLDSWGQPVLVSDDSYQKASTRDSSKILLDIYRSPDFWEKVDTARQTKDTEALTLLCAVWMEVDPKDRKRLLSEIFIGALGKTPTSLDKKEITEIFGQIFQQDPHLISTQYLVLILVDFTYGERISPIPEFDSALSCNFFKTFAYRKYCSASLSKLEKGEDVSHVAVLLKTLFKMSGKGSGWRLFAGILAEEYDYPDWACTEEDLEKLSAVFGEKSLEIRYLRALKNKSRDEIKAVAKDHFYPAYSLAAQYFFEEKNYEEAAYFHYLQWRHPGNGCRGILAAEAPEVLRKIMLPQAEQFCKALLFTGKYEEAITFFSYFERAAFNDEEEIPELAQLKNFIGRELILRKQSFSKEAASRGVKICKELDYFSFPEFDSRYKKEICGAEGTPD